MTDYERERIALDYIQNNPHIALKHAVIAHRTWHGCDCTLDTLAHDVTFCKQYNIQPLERPNESQSNV
jgi:hypothetical protein